MRLRDPSRVPIMECNLLNNYENNCKKAKDKPLFLWPKPFRGHEFNKVELDTVIDVVKFLSLFDAVMNCDSKFQQKWTPCGLKKYYGSSEKGKYGTNHTNYYYEVCSFLLKLNDINRKLIFYEIQGKFLHDPVMKNISYDNFIKVFAFLTHMTIFLDQWKLNLFEAFSVEFSFNKFNDDFASDFNNVLFSNQECCEIKNVCEWFIPIYFRFVTIQPHTLEKLITIYNLHKNKPPLCIYKKLHDDSEQKNNKVNDFKSRATMKSKKEDAALQTLSDIRSRIQSCFQEDRGDDFDPNADQGHSPEYYSEQINEYFKKNADNIEKKTPDSGIKVVNADTNITSSYIKKSKMEIFEEKNPDFFDKQIETAIALAGFSGGVN